MNKKAFTIALSFLLLLSGSLVVGGETAVGEYKALEDENGAFFEVEIIDYDEEVELGDEVTIEYKVTNTGNETDTQDLVLSVEDEEINRDEDVTLEPGDEWNNTVTYDTSEVDVLSSFIEFSTDLSLLLESNNDSHSGKITVSQPILDMPGFTFILLPVGVIFAVLIYHKKKR
ncbi:MAG: hypothetical protein KGY66_07120 [Candidatus Thermoplasmatota archaeon]|nr:hypothetical protein [Candidatus Thermoplasmatota archaeon]MBS3790671.1 hypothetical protein [Candidatus Thermoplasmatota archaeon]